MTRLQRGRHVGTALLLTMMLAACGQKGDLYRPSDPAPEPAQPGEERRS